MILPVIENDRPSLLAFQSVVFDAIVYSFEGYEVTHMHRTSIFSEDLYDSAVISWEGRPDLD